MAYFYDLSQSTQSHQTLEARLLSKIQQPHSSQKPESDIDQYFDGPRAQIPKEAANDINWLFNW